MVKPLLWTLVLVASPLLAVRSFALELPSLDHVVVDCSGCTADQKRAAALHAPYEALLYAEKPGEPGEFGSGIPADNDTVTTVDVTDFESDVIVRYRVTLSRQDGGIARTAILLSVPPATQQRFNRADALIDEAVLDSGESFVDAVDAVPLPVAYASAFELLEDTGYQSTVLAGAVNDALAPDGSLQDLVEMCGDYLSQDRSMAVEAEDGTIILVSPKLVVGGGILWVVIADGLRLANGTVLGSA